MGFPVVVRLVVRVVAFGLAVGVLSGCAVGVSVSVIACRSPRDVLDRDAVPLRSVHALPDQQRAEVGRPDDVGELPASCGVVCDPDLQHGTFSGGR